MYHSSYQAYSSISRHYVEYTRLFYRQLETEKCLALKNSGWNVESNMTLSATARNDIVWWINHAQTSKRKD